MNTEKEQKALTIEELISKLKDCPKDAKVYTEELHGFHFDLVKVVEVFYIKKGFSKPMVLLKTS